MNNIDLNSKQWCELVFEGKNHDFGAYEMRRDSAARHNKAMLNVTILAIVVILLPSIIRIVAPKKEAEEKTKSGIILASSAQEKPELYEVIEVGPGGMVDGHDVVMTVKPGDKVITSKHSGTGAQVDDAAYTVVRQSDILAIVE